MPLLTLPPAQARRRRRFVVILVESIGIIANTVIFIAMRTVLTNFTTQTLVLITVFNLILLQAILFLVIKLVIGFGKEQGS